MEGTAVATSLYGMIATIGLVPTLAIFGVALFFVMKDIRKQCSSAVNAVNALRDHSDKKDAEMTERMEKLECDIRYVEHEYMTKKQHYQDTEGWKTEIQTLRQDMNRIPYELMHLMKKE